MKNFLDSVAILRYEHAPQLAQPSPMRRTAGPTHFYFQQKQNWQQDPSTKTKVSSTQDRSQILDL